MPATQAPIETEVLVVGAGPVGLSLAIELGQRGIRTTVIEQHDRVGRQPRAKTTNVRSMEHMRRWGIAENLREASPLPADYPTDIVFATRLFGYELARFENAFSGKRERNELFAEPAQWTPQYKVEAVLRDHALTLPAVDLRFGTRLESFEENPAGVEAAAAEAEPLSAGRRTARPAAGGTRRILARYLVGADGAKSLVRDLLGIAMEGEHAFARNYGIVYRAPGLGRMHPQKPAIMYWLVNPDQPGLTGPMDVGDTWHMIISAPTPAGPFGEREARRAVAAAIGRDLDLEILTIDPWSAHSLIAERYGAGRVFLAGDACHLHPPFGGYGMNMGIGDAVDLGWKLAAVLRGWGGHRLLASYGEERRPVHRKVVAEAVANSALLSQDLIRAWLEASGPAGEALRAEVGAEILATKIREFKTLGVVLGIPYRGSPIIVPDGTDPPAWNFSDYRPSASPGCRAPHLWLGDGRSLYDLFGRGFTLLVTKPGGRGEAPERWSKGGSPGAAAEGARLARAAAALGLLLDLVAPADRRLAELYGAGLALIRPDQHVAWRGDRLDRPPAEILDRVRGA